MQKKLLETNQSFMLEVKMAARKKAIWSSPGSASKPLFDLLNMCTQLPSKSSSSSFLFSSRGTSCYVPVFAGSAEPFPSFYYVQNV